MDSKFPDILHSTQSGVKPVLKPSAQFHGLCAAHPVPGSNNSKFLSDINKSEIIGSVEKAVIELLFLHGLRISEVLNISSSDVMGNGSIMIKGLKGSSNRLVYSIMYSSFWSSAYLLHLPLSSLYNRWYFYRLFKKMGYVKKYPGNVNYSVTHSFRHLYVKDLQNQGIPDSDISQFIGHRSKKTLEYYVK